MCCQYVTEGLSFFPPFIKEAIRFTTTIMTTTFGELLGEQLLQYNESSGEANEISTNELHGKTVALYFSFVIDISIE